MRYKKELKKVTVSAFVFLLLFLGSSSQSQAQQIPTSTDVQTMQDLPGNIHLGPLKIHPGVSVKEDYTTNIFRDYENRNSAFITTVSPRLVLQLPIRRHFLQIDYRADIIEAERFHKQYDTDSHFANLILDLDFNRINILAGDNWESNSTPPNSEMDIRNDYYQNRAFCDVSYRLADRYKVTGFYRNTSRNFDDFRSPWDPTADPEWDNYMENDMGIDLFYRFFPKTFVLFEYGFTHRNLTDRGLPDTDRDSDSHRYWLGFMWEATEKITGTIKGGYYKRDYDKGGNSKDWDGFGMEGDLEYKLTYHDTFTLKGFRKLLETSFTDSSVPMGGPGRYGTYYTSTGGTFAYNHRFTYKISGIADVSFFNDDYRQKGSLGKKREDDRFAAGISGLYRIQDWLGLKLGYRYTNNDSNVDVESYREDLFFGTLSLTF